MLKKFYYDLKEHLQNIKNEAGERVFREIGIWDWHMMLSSAGKRKIQCPALFLEFEAIKPDSSEILVSVKFHIITDNHASTDISLHERQEWKSINLVNLILMYMDVNKLDYLNCFSKVEVISKSYPDYCSRIIDGIISLRRDTKYGIRDFDPQTDIPGEYRFKFREEPTPSELGTLGRYVTKEILQKFDCRTVEYYERATQDVVHIFYATGSNPFFHFDCGDFALVYKPMETLPFRFLNIGKRPKNYIFGLKQVLDSECEYEGLTKGQKPKPNAIVRELYKCDGIRDVLNLASLGSHYHGYSILSEIDFPEDVFREIDRYTGKHFQITTADKTELDMAIRNTCRHKDLRIFKLPAKIKDKRLSHSLYCNSLTDFINKAGNDQTETSMHFGEINIINDNACNSFTESAEFIYHIGGRL